VQPRGSSPPAAGEEQIEAGAAAALTPSQVKSPQHFIFFFVFTSVFLLVKL
jgi:hypothetical protein